jgi:hypothetical protein
VESMPFHKDDGAFGMLLEAAQAVKKSIHIHKQNNLLHMEKSSLTFM